MITANKIHDWITYLKARRAEIDRLIRAAELRKRTSASLR